MKGLCLMVTTVVNHVIGRRELRLPSGLVFCKESDRPGQGLNHGYSASLSAIDFADVHYKNMLVGDELQISTEVKLKRIAEAGFCAVDPGFAQGLYEQPHQATLNWLYQDRGITRVDFLGKFMRRSDGRVCVVVLVRNMNQDWLLNYEPADLLFGKSHQSAIYRLPKS